MGLVDGRQADSEFNVKNKQTKNKRNNSDLGHGQVGRYHLPEFPTVGDICMEPDCQRLPGTDPGGCHLSVLAFHPGSDTRSLWLLTSGAGVVLSCPG